MFLLSYFILIPVLCVIAYNEGDRDILLTAGIVSLAVLMIQNLVLMAWTGYLAASGRNRTWKVWLGLALSIVLYALGNALAGNFLKMIAA